MLKEVDKITATCGSRQKKINQISEEETMLRVESTEVIESSVNEIASENSRESRRKSFRTKSIRK